MNKRIYLMGAMAAILCLAAPSHSEGKSQGPVFRKGRSPETGNRSAPMALAIPPIITSGMNAETSAGLKLTLKQYLGEMKHFRIIEDSVIEAVWKKLKEEEDQSECLNFECAMEIGRWAEAQRILMADAYVEGETWNLELRLVDAMSGTILKRRSDTYEGHVAGFLGETVRGLVDVVASLPKARVRDTSRVVVKVIHKEGESVKHAPLQLDLPVEKVTSSRKWWWMSGGTALAAGLAATYFVLNPFAEETPRQISLSRQVNIE